jgi:tetratricopeptide (TPR) repeat protein
LDISQRAIECWEQSLIIAREIGDLEIVAANSFNAALSYARQGESERALPLAQDAVNIWMQLGNPNIQQAQKLVRILQKSGTSVPEQTNPMQAAIIAFTSADSILSIQKAVTQYPLMREDYFLQVVERFINQPFPFEQKRVLKQHLKWLRELIGKPNPGFFEQLFGRKG